MCLSGILCAVSVLLFICLDVLLSDWSVSLTLCLTTCMTMYCPLRSFYYPPVCLPVLVNVSILSCPFICLSVCLYVSLKVCLTTYMAMYCPLCSFTIRLSAGQFMLVSAYQTVYISNCLHIELSAYRIVCFFVCLFI